MKKMTKTCIIEARLQQGPASYEELMKLSGASYWCVSAVIRRLYAQGKRPHIVRKAHPRRKVRSYEDVFLLREGGATFAEIGEALGISRQRAHQICQKGNLTA